MSVIKYWNKETQKWEKAQAPTSKNNLIQAQSTMLASNWVNKFYSFEDTYPRSKFNLLIEVSSEVTEEQFDAFSEARICAVINSNTVKAITEIPTIDIPVLLTITPKSADDPVEVEVIMAADKWIDNMYSFEDIYPSTEYNMTIEVSSNATKEQFDAFSEARICAITNSNVAKAISDVPTMDIPVLLKVVAR